jgi:O-antigen/teichoic acid export membrane protein
MDRSSIATERRIAVNTVSNYVAFGITTIVQFFLIRYLIALIGERFYGLQALASQALQFVSLASMAIGASYNRYATEHYANGDIAEMNAVLSVGLALSLLSAGLLAVGTLLTASFVRPLFDLQPDMVSAARLVILVTGAGMAVHIISGPWKAPVFMLERFYLNSIGGIVSTVGAALLVLAIFHFTAPSIVLWALIQSGWRVGAELLIVIPCALHAMPQLRLSLRRALAHRATRSLATFSGMSFLGGIGQLLYYATDSIMIASLDELHFEQVTFYNVAQRWSPMILGVITAFVSVLTPMLTSDWAQANIPRMRRTLTRATRYSLILALYPCVAMFILAASFFEHWLGALSPDYVTLSAPVMQIGMVGLLCTVPGAVAYEALFAAGRIRGAVVAMLAGGVANVVLSITLVKACGLGLTGIALGSTVSLAFVHVIFIPRRANLAMGLTATELARKAFFRPLAGSVPLAVACIACRTWWHAPNLAVVMLQFLVGGLVYAPAVWFIALLPEDRQKSGEAIAAIRRRFRPVRST